MEMNPWNGNVYSDGYYRLLEQRQNLPVWRKKNVFLTAFNENRIVILVSEPRAGKSTQIPQFVAEAVDLKGLKVCCTQPNRVAAMCVSARVANEMDVILGEEVGYTVPFEDHTSPKTVLKYVTDDVLVREAMEDPVLSNYKVIVLDEVHQRTQATDILMGYLKTLLDSRTDLKIILLTVDIEVERYQTYFDNPPLIRVPITKVLFPVKITFLERRLGFLYYLQKSIQTVVEMHMREPPGGDILLFLPSKEDVEYASKGILELVACYGNFIAPLIVVPLFPELPIEMQQMIFPPAPPQVGIRARRVIVSTDIAETSLPIDDIAIVIDPGYIEKRVFRQKIGVEVLTVSRISRENAYQRMCCAGRTRVGKCFRLYDSEFFLSLRPTMPPKIHESDMASMVLALKRLNVPNFLFFEYLDPPKAETMMEALYLLNHLGIMNEEADLTPLGDLVSRLPVNPLLGKVLVESCRFNCSVELLTIAAMLSVPSYINPEHEWETANDANRAFRHVSGDHFTLLNLFNMFKKMNSDESPRWCSENSVVHWVLKSADNVRQQLESRMNHLKVDIISSMGLGLDDAESYNNIMKALFSGFYLHLAYRLHDESTDCFFDVEGKPVHECFRTTCMDHTAEWMIFNDLDLTFYNNKMKMINTSSVRSEWLAEFASDIYDLAEFPEGSMKDHLELLMHKKMTITHLMR